MSSQNRFLLPHTTSALGSGVKAATTNNAAATSAASTNSNSNEQENQISVDEDFDSYWEEQARKTDRNRIRIGRQYQATVPPLLKSGESDQRKLADLETLTFCPKRSAKVSDAELEHYFTVAKSLTLFASLVETRSLLGRDVTIADLNHIRNKEGLSLASVIQPNRQTANHGTSPKSSQQQIASTTTSKSSPIKSPTSMLNDNKPTSSTSVPSPSETVSQSNANPEVHAVLNQPLMKALSHFISLHHPCHHDQDCKKVNKNVPLEDESPAISITAGNLRQASSSSVKSRSRSALKQQQAANVKQMEETIDNGSNLDQDQSIGDNCASQSATCDDWTKEEIEMFSKAIEVCGKNFGSIKKEFLPTKSVRSIVEYYYIGSRDALESKKKPSQNIETTDRCNSPEKSQTNSSGSGGGGGGGDGVGDASGSTSLNGKGGPSTSSAQNIDARMSVYNFDEFKDESPIKPECLPRPGAEVKPLKAKPIVPNAALDSEAGISNVGSLKFFMDGQLVLKLNACQDQQEGADKCHWVQSGEKALQQNRQKRYSKRANSDNRASSEQSLNGSHSNSVLSSNNEDDLKNEDLSMDEDSKESATSFSNTSTPQRPKKQPTPKRAKIVKSNDPAATVSNQAPSPKDYNRIAINNRIKERNDNMKSQSPIAPTPLLSQASAAANMPNWLQANQFAMAAAILGGLPYPAAAAAAAAGNMMQNISSNNNDANHMLHQTNNTSAVNMATSKPMDLSLEHTAPKTILSKPASRPRSKQKN